MTISFAMIVFGGLLIYAGWKDLSLGALSRGDNTKAKKAPEGGFVLPTHS